MSDNYANPFEDIYYFLKEISNSNFYNCYIVFEKRFKILYGI